MKIYKEWRQTAEFLRMIFIKDTLLKNRRVLWSQRMIQAKIIFQSLSLMIAHFILIRINLVSQKLYHQELLHKMNQIMKATKEMSLTLTKHNSFLPKKLHFIMNLNLSKTMRHASQELKLNVSTSENSKDKNKLKMNKCKEN